MSEIITEKKDGDLTTGQFKGTAAPYAQRPTRKPELYTGEPPQNDGKTPMSFVIQERCNIEEVNKDGKKVKCTLKLNVARVKNQKFERDESGFGGQLNYDEKDVRQYKVCPKHGGLPPDYAKWETGAKV